jgi:hypothetical protein
MKSTERKPEKVYRYMPVHRLWQVLATKRLYFMRNSKWDDPFEGFLVKRYCKIAGKDFVLLNTNKFFLCCCRFEERDHLWRNYTPNKDGVLVKLNIDGLLALQGPIKCHPIRYPKKHEIKKMLDRIDGGEFPEDQILSLFFIKRYAFDPEKEIRFLLENSTIKDDTYGVKIEPNGIIENVLFDPRMDHDTYEYHRKFIQDRFGIANISHSTLYDPERSFGPGKGLQRHVTKSSTRR